MAVIQGGASGALADVDTTFLAQRISQRPVQNLGWYSVGATSGALTGVAAAAPVFSLRNITSPNLLMVRRVSVGFSTTTAFTAAQALEYDLFFARTFTASDSAGTAIAITGNLNKLRTSLATPTSLDCRISAAAAITAGTRTLDTVALGIAAGSSTGVGTTMPLTTLMAHEAGAHPIILAQNEGLVITNGIAMGAIGVIRLYVNIEFAEVAAY